MPEEPYEGYDQAVQSLQQWGEQQAQPAYSDAPPAIYDAGVRSQRAPLPERAFRPFRPGDDAGTLDPMITGQPLPDEALLLHLQNRVGQLQLSTGEQMRLQRYQNGLSAVQEAMANGNLFPQDAAQLQGMIGQQMGPLQVRASQLPVAMNRLRYHMMQQDMARQATIEQQDNRFAAQTMDQRTRHIRTPDGGTVTIVENGRGRPPTIVDRPRQEGQQSQNREAVARTRAIDAATRLVDQQIRDQTLDPSERVDAIERVARERMEVEQRLAGGQPQAEAQLEPPPRSPWAQPGNRQGSQPAGQTVPSTPRQEPVASERIGQDGRAYPTINPRRMPPASSPELTTWLNDVDQTINRQGRVTSQLGQDAQAAAWLVRTYGARDRMPVERRRQLDVALRRMGLRTENEQPNRAPDLQPTVAQRNPQDRRGDPNVGLMDAMGQLYTDQ